MKQLTACCGLDCESCEARIATIANDDELREKTARKWSAMNNAPEITAELFSSTLPAQKKISRPDARFIYGDSTPPDKKNNRHMRASCRRQCSGAEKQTGSLIQPLSHPSKNTSASRRNIVSPYILPGKKTTAKTKNTKNVCTDEKNYIISPTLNGHSSVGRALVSKTKCREFESLCPCRTTKTTFPAVFLLAKTFF